MPSCPFSQRQRLPVTLSSQLVSDLLGRLLTPVNQSHRHGVLKVLEILTRPSFLGSSPLQPVLLSAPNQQLQVVIGLAPISSSWFGNNHLELGQRYCIFVCLPCYCPYCLQLSEQLILYGGEHFTQVVGRVIPHYMHLFEKQAWHSGCTSSSWGCICLSFLSSEVVLGLPMPFFPPIRQG